MKALIYPSFIETARALILHLLNIMKDDPDKTFHIAFSGGSTPALMYDLWANEYKDITPWTRIKLYFVDERCVPPENSESNYGMINSLMLGAIPIPYENVFRIKGEENPEKEAVRYSGMVKRQLPSKDGWPVFDVVLLGAGTDGHTSSIFPGQEKLLTSDKIYVVSHNPNNGQKRIAMTGCAIINARHVIFLITGRNKAGVVAEMCTFGDTGPAAYVAHHAENAELFLDDYAASKINVENLLKLK